MKKLKRYWNNLSKKQKIVFTTIAVLIVAGLGVAAALLLSDEETDPDNPPEPIYSQLTGAEVDQEVADRPVLGVMIENSPSARPQTGLSSASIVFESPTEGGITRYLALYQEDIPEEITPVRSVRPYFVNWIMGFDGSIAHVGGSQPALDMLENRNAKTLNQFTYPDPYYRTDERAPPHNMVAETDKLRDLQEELGHETAKFTPIPRSKDSPAAKPNAATISINFSSPTYAAGFEYQKQANSYLRFLSGEEDTDAEAEKQIQVKNVVVIKMNGPEVDAIGSGEALVFKNGKVIEAEWKQSDYTERIMLTDQQGNEIKLNRGKTWFSVLQNTGSVDYAPAADASSETQ